MDESIVLRCVKVAQYMLEKRATVRQAANACGLSKSSVHKDMICRLPQIDARLGREIAALLNRSAATVGSQIARGRERLRKLLEED